MLQSAEPSRSWIARTKARIVISLVGTVVACSSFASSAQASPSDLPPEVAHDYATLETPRMTAVGGLMRATANSVSALYCNPANMAIAQVYHVAAFGQIYPEGKRQAYGVAVADSLISSSGLAGGFGAVWSFQDPDGINRQWMDLRFGLAMPLGDIFFLGLSGKYIVLQQNGVGPLGLSYASGGLPDSNILQTFTFDAGMTLRPVPEFTIAISGTNLTNMDNGLVPLTGGIGIGFSSNDFSLNADATVESKTFEKTNVIMQGGGEFLAIDRIAIRGGYRYDQGLRTQALSGGLAYLDQRFSIDASVRRSVSGYSYTAVMFGFTVHIEAMGLGPGKANPY